MDKESYLIEGLLVEIERLEDKEIDDQKRKLANLFKAVREQSGMTRKDFANWLGIPYRTMQEWELGRRAMPDYVLKLIAYKVVNEKKAGRIKN